MSKNDFLLHYPDGECSSTPRDGVKPDAFLFKKDRLNAYWVSLPIKIEAVSRPYAIETARKTKFNGHPCRLLNVFDLWVMLKHIRKINDLLRELGMPELLVKEEAAAYWSQKQPHYSGIRWTGSSFSIFSEDTEVSKAIAIYAASDFNEARLAHEKDSTKVQRTFYKGGKLLVRPDKKRNFGKEITMHSH